MKIRNGFVSNSSSSSFVVFMKKDYFKEFYDSLEDYEQEVVNHVKSNDNKKLDDDSFVILSGFQGNINSFECEFIWAKDEYSDETDEYIETYGPDGILTEKVLPKLDKNKSISVWTDM